MAWPSSLLSVGVEFKIDSVRVPVKRLEVERGIVFVDRHLKILQRIRRKSTRTVLLVGAFDLPLDTPNGPSNFFGNGPELTNCGGQGMYSLGICYCRYSEHTTSGFKLSGCR